MKYTCRGRSRHDPLRGACQSKEDAAGKSLGQEHIWRERLKSNQYK